MSCIMLSLHNYATKNSNKKPGALIFLYLVWCGVLNFYQLNKFEHPKIKCCTSTFNALLIELEHFAFVGKI